MRGGVGGLVGWFSKILLPANQGKIPVRFEWKIGKNLRIPLLPHCEGIFMMAVVLVLLVLCLSQLCDINNR